jgi:hypothetical protein
MSLRSFFGFGVSRNLSSNEIAFRDSFCDLSQALGVDVRGSLTSEKVISRVRDSIAKGFSPHEMAYANAIGVYLALQVKDPRPFPNDLQSTIASGRDWSEQNLIRPGLYRQTVLDCVAELKKHGLKI